jgi:Mg2+/Co2+ transporter CorC
MTTIGGVILRHIDRLPEIGDEVIIEGIRLTVKSMDGHRIERICATPVSTHSEKEEASPADEAAEASQEPLDGSGRERR